MQARFLSGIDLAVEAILNTPRRRLMPDHFKVGQELDHVSGPVTALAYLHTQSTTLLLAGEGPLLRVFDNSTHQLIGAVRVFRTQAIHGIHVHGVVGNNAAESAVPYVLVWGGRSVCCIRLEPIIAGSQGRSHIQFRPLVLETHLTDWIFDACFLSTQPDVDATHIDAVVLTAHNILLFLNVPVLLNECSARKYVMNEAAAGPRSILYSGHVILLASGKVLVAAGTAFGELLLWSCKVEEAPSVSWQMKSRLLHYTFLGHEGSIFGVRISDGFPLPGSDTVQRILASCSDDRTIRIWDISDVTNGTPIDWQEDMATTPVETGFTTSDSHANQVSSSLLAVAMGHLSRIWGVRFLSRRGPIQQLVSYGEDASLQLWEIDLTNSLRSSSKMPEIPLGVLRHLDTYKFHSGKHIWSVALFADPNGAWKISTGGADGCITHYNMPLQNKCGRLWSMSDIWDKCVGSARDLNSSTVSTVARSSAICATKATFTALEGKWILKRTIESALPLYPSGIFEGSAIFQKRTPTDPEYDMEFLYVEEGEFATKQGLTLSGSRRYVYRYQAITDVITAWFVNVDDKTSVDYYFHNLNFPDTESGVPRLSRWGASSSTATGYHLCKKDDYWIYYIFSFDGANLRNLNLQYKVNGPVKDYMADASYTRPDNVNHQSKPAYDSVNAAHRAQNAGNTSTELQRPDLGSQDSFKSYAWVSDVEFLTTTDQGHILLGSLQDTNQLPTQGFENRDSSLVVSWERLTHLDHLKSYCLATSVEEDGMAFLSGTEGTIYLYQHCGRSISPLITLPRKISGLFAQALDQRTDPLQPLSSLSHIGMVASCLGSTTANAIILVVNPSGPEESRYSIVREITLILPSNFIVTSGGFACLQKLVVLGSRDGALALYDFSPFSDDETGIVVSCCVRYVHGEEAVTAIKNVPLAWPAADTSSGYVLTTGRDGRYAVHQWNLEPALQASKLTLETVLVGSPSFGPNIEGAAFQPSTQELLLWGFRSKHFVVWNHTERREVMAIECGGTHRSWSFSPGLKNLGSRMSLVWTKASTCYIDSRPRASHGVLQDGGHGREIKAMAISLSKYDDGGVCSRLVATGAEDTAIRIFSYKGLNSDVKGSSLQCIGTFAKHTAGLQQLQWSKAGHYLFSAAGCEEFYIWRVQPLPLFGIGVVCDARCPVKSDSADLRIMDFDVVDIRGEGKESAKIKHRFLITMVYSDSSLRIYCFDPVREQDKFELVLEGTYGTVCLTQALTIHLGHDFYLCTASTDGHFACWPLTVALHEKGITSTKNQLQRSARSSQTTRVTPITWTNRRQIHQNSIKSMIAVHLSDDETILATAGDDNALAFTRLTSSPTAPIRIPSSSTLLIPHAHAAAITAVQYLGPVISDCTISTVSKHRFATSGPDQRLKFWLLNINRERPGADGMQVAKVGNAYTSVADVACLDGFEATREEGGRVFVAGIGVEVWRAGGKEEWLGVEEELVRL